MTAETEAERQQREDEFRQRMQRDGDLGLLLCEHLSGLYGDDMHLGGEDFEMAYAEEVPGYEDENFAVLLRRKSDGRIFEADIEGNHRPGPAACGGDAMSWSALLPSGPGTPPAIRDIIARLEKIGDGDAMQAFRRLCTATRICSTCGGSWDNPDYACECISGPAGAP